MFFRKSALPLVEEWRRVIKSDPTRLWDQGEFNRIARQKWDPGRTSGLSDPRLFSNATTARPRLATAHWRGVYSTLHPPP